MKWKCSFKTDLVLPRYQSIGVMLAPNMQSSVGLLRSEHEIQIALSGDAIMSMGASTAAVQIAK